MFLFLPTVVAGAVLQARQVSVPEYFQTSPEIFAGPTPTGFVPFLVATNPVAFPGQTYLPANPIQTQEYISGYPTPTGSVTGPGSAASATADANIFHLMGQLSPYFVAPGFGVDELPLPSGTNVTWLNMLSRHGSRYPAGGGSTQQLANSINNATGSNITFTGPLSFLNTYKYPLGAEILTPNGKQELFDSGTTHYYQYGRLAPNNGTKIIARSTHQDRMTQSAEYFLAGFFGLGWTNNATLELSLDQTPFNNSLAGYNACPASNDNRTNVGVAGSYNQWISLYLRNATQRLNRYSNGFNWTTSQAYAAQQLCPYETVALGYSSWCDLFTYEEWQGYEYSVDLDFSAVFGFESPVGRAIGVGYVAEVLARINNHLITSPVGDLNITLDSMPSTFPTNQPIYFDFSHDVNIFSVLTAFGLTQFKGVLNPTSIQKNRTAIVSNMTPFGARLDIEIINAPYPVSASRTLAQLRSNSTAVYDYGGNATQYIHFLLNQRTVPLGRSYALCGNRTDGWCELGAFLNATANLTQQANFDYACFGNYTPPAYGQITNGAIFANGSAASRSAVSSASSSAYSATISASTRN
ncbi:hypothetical protein PYCC9005_002756 [Savitreella phatthalungensis]